MRNENNIISSYLKGNNEVNRSNSKSNGKKKTEVKDIDKASIKNKDLASQR